MRSTILCLIAITAIALPVRAQTANETRRAEVLVLGTYHMANPGHDLFNMKADDVLAPKRQAEIAEVMAALKAFKPTKIAIESDSQKKFDERYAQYLAGKYELTTNEIDQIGLRLAKEMGHTKIYAVDADGDFPFQRVINFAKASGQSAKLDAHIADIGEMVKAQGNFLQTHTVLQTLLYMNSDEKVAQSVGFYYLEAHYGEPSDYAGPDLLAEWYRRNLCIFNNVTMLVTSRDDRILVIFGAGHLGWLRQAFGSDPTLRLRKLEEFAPR